MSRQAGRLALGGGAEFVRKIVLAQRDLDFHAGIGVVAEHVDDLGERLAVRRRLLDELRHDDLAGLGLAAHVGGNEDVLADALVLGDEIPDAVVRVDAADDLAIGARQHVDDGAFGAPALVDADLSRGGAIAVQRLVHLLGRQEQIRAAVVGNKKAEAVGMSLHDAGHQVDLGDDAQLTLAVGHELAVALHRRETSAECLALRVAFDAQRGQYFVGMCGYTELTQMRENRLTRGNVDVADTTCGSSCRLAGSFVAGLVFRGKFL